MNNYIKASYKFNVNFSWMLCHKILDLWIFTGLYQFQILQAIILLKMYVNYIPNQQTCMKSIMMYFIRAYECENAINVRFHPNIRLGIHWDAGVHLTLDISSELDPIKKARIARWKCPIHLHTSTRNRLIN